MTACPVTRSVSSPDEPATRTSSPSFAPARAMVSRPSVTSSGARGSRPRDDGGRDVAPHRPDREPVRRHAVHAQRELRTQLRDRVDVGIREDGVAVLVVDPIASHPHPYSAGVVTR